jgi:hypothetical protein
MSGRRRDTRYRLAVPQSGSLCLAAPDVAIPAMALLARESGLPVRLLDVSLTGCLLESSRRLEIGTEGDFVIQLGGRDFRQTLRTTRCERPDGSGPMYRVGARFIEDGRDNDATLRRAIAVMLGARSDTVFVDQT